jgi:hypothetical protein
MKERFDFEFHNHTGYVLTKRGLLILLRAVVDLHNWGNRRAVVQRVPTMKGIYIDVLVNKHGMATYERISE